MKIIPVDESVLTVGNGEMSLVSSKNVLIKSVPIDSHALLSEKFPDEFKPETEMDSSPCTLQDSESSEE